MDRLGSVLLAVPAAIATASVFVREESVGFWETASKAQKVLAVVTGSGTVAAILVSAGIGLASVTGTPALAQRNAAALDTMLANRSAATFRSEHETALASAREGHPVTPALLEELRDEIVCEVNRVLPGDCSYWLSNGRPSNLRNGRDQ